MPHYLPYPFSLSLPHIISTFFELQFSPTLYPNE